MANTFVDATDESPVDSVEGRTGAVDVAKSDVGLGNADNTSDANKPISTATQTALDLKAPLASPTFTGVTTLAPTGTSGVTTVLAINNEADTVPRISCTANGTGLILSVGSTMVLQIQDNGEILMGTGPITLPSRFTAGDNGTIITSGADDRIPLRVKQNSGSQTGNLTEWTNAASGILARMSAAGILFGSVSYTPADTNDWPGADPTTIAQALDLLAARLNVLEP